MDNNSGVKRDLVAAIIIENGRILILHNIKHGLLRAEPPGGKVHAGEAIDCAVKREVIEELGVSVSNLRPFGVFETDSPEGDFQVHMYLCDIAEGAPRLLEKEKFSGFGWCTFAELIEFKDSGALVRNMVSALDDLRVLML
ncbi:NUDIX hydrolase [bacterium]|nr:MAG: NUDIX hydrolase [bacterium]